MTVGIIYASKKGSTAEIAERVADRLEELGHQVDLINTGVAKTVDHPYDAIVLLTPIYKGLWLPDMNRFLRHNREIIGDTPAFGLFPCIRVLEESGKQHAHSNYLPEHLVNHLNLVGVRFIAGKMIRAELSLDDLQTLNTRYDGTKLNHIQGDYRDWVEIHNWTSHVSKLIKARSQKRIGNPTS